MITITRLESLGINIHVEKDEIVCRADKVRGFDRPQVLGLLTELKAKKPEALQFLRSRTCRHAIRVFSKVLNKEITISWTGENPKVIHIDKVAYTLTEIEKLKALAHSGKELSAIHQLKDRFDGELLNDDPHIHDK
jgi:hypothetical protein